MDFRENNTQRRGKLNDNRSVWYHRTDGGVEYNKYNTRRILDREESDNRIVIAEDDF